MTGPWSRTARHHRLGWAAAALAVALVAAGSLLSSCTSARNDLGTVDSRCFIAIPAATAAVHEVGHLEGVRLVGLAALRTRQGLLYRAALRAPGRTAQTLCLVAFSGRFRADRVISPVGDLTGRLAVVALGYPDNRVLATLLARRPPFAFGHSHIGLL